MITTITITGIDERTDLVALQKIRDSFPMLDVEFGVLVSPRHVGSKRFPNGMIIHRLKHQDFNLSLHLCGQFVDRILMGDMSMITGSYIWPYWSLFDRVQINTHGEEHPFDEEKLKEIIAYNEDKEFILQHDQANQVLIEALRETPNVSCLYDLSHGAGVLPSTAWKKPEKGYRTGYAGGLGPDNLAEQLPKIDKVSGINGWIDMETRVRDEDDWLDLDKVAQVLEIFKMGNVSSQE